MVDPQARRRAVGQIRQAHGASERRACKLLGQPHSIERYQAKPKEEDALLRRIAELSKERPRFGYRRLTALLQREGVSVWHGHVHRIYQRVAVASALSQVQALGSR